MVTYLDDYTTADSINECVCCVIWAECRYHLQLTLFFFFPLPDRKIGEDSEEVTLGFASKNSSAMPDLTKGPDSKADPIQMPPLTFSKVSAREGMTVQYSAV